LPPEDKYSALGRDRKRYTTKVVASCSTRKLVVAGPGTGKTYLFGALLQGKSNTLTLTFVNALVEDLSLALLGLSKVMTLHGFALRQLRDTAKVDVRVFPKMPSVVAEDAKILLGQDIDFAGLFHNRCDGDANLEFYEKRRSYYGHYGFPDMVNAAVRYFETHQDRIPTYSQIVVDEFQDFNALEVSLIDLLASKSPILLVGDDDQALYETLKSASAEHIRHRHKKAAYGYQTFFLPYCSRCTRVIVDAVNDIIARATESGHLKGRINKPFVYFEDREKDEESRRNPYLVHAQVYFRQVPWAVGKCIRDMAAETRSQFSVLVISPTRRQCRTIVDGLRDKGFLNVRFAEPASGEPTLLEGLNILLKDRESNLGWRLATKSLLDPTEFGALLAETHRANPPKLRELVGKTHRQRVEELLKFLRAVRDGKNLGDEKQVLNLLRELGLDAIGLAAGDLRAQVESKEQPQLDPGLRNTFIRATTIPSAKGLAADCVFITYCDDRYLIKDKKNISDQDICGFIVALTRARKRVFLISTDGKQPTFLRWISKQRIRHVSLD